MAIETFRILLVDDHLLFLEGVEGLLSGLKNVQVSGRAHNGREALLQLRKQPADLVLLDYQMPEMDGLATLSEIRKFHPGTKVMILSMHKSAALVQEVMKAGAEGFLLKTADREEFLLAVKKVLSGGKYFSAEVMEEMMRPALASQQFVPDEPLTDRETEIIREIVNGLSTQEIAEKLFISPRTVETHRKNLMAKLNMKNLASLVRWALEGGIQGL